MKFPQIIEASSQVVEFKAPKKLEVSTLPDRVNNLPPVIPAPSTNFDKYIMKELVPTLVHLLLYCHSNCARTRAKT